MRLFVDTKQAAQIMGLGTRTLIHNYVETGKLRQVVFKGSERSGRVRRRMFLRADVEKLKR